MAQWRVVITLLWDPFIALLPIHQLGNHVAVLLVNICFIDVATANRRTALIIAGKIIL